MPDYCPPCLIVHNPPALVVKYRPIAKTCPASCGCAPCVCADCTCGVSSSATAVQSCPGGVCNVPQYAPAVQSCPGGVCPTPQTVRRGLFGWR